jgi:DNA-binding CsgD family transcriptional regulator/PAS domain-containing protein
MPDIDSAPQAWDVWCQEFNVFNSEPCPFMNHRAPYPSRDTTHFSDLAHLIYEAAIYPERWPQLMTTIASTFGADKGLLFTPFVPPQSGGLIFPTGISEESLQLWASVYIDLDLWAQAGMNRGLWKAGNVVVDEEMVSLDELLASRFYQEFLRTMNIGRVVAGIVFDNSPGLMATALAIFRSPEDPAFNDEDIEWMRMIVAHVSRSLGFMQRLKISELHRKSAMAALDRLKFGVVLMDKQMQIVRMNQAAQAAVARKDGLLQNSGNRMDSAYLSVDTQGLGQWLESLRQTPLIELSHFLDGCTVQRRNHDQRYIIQCTPVAQNDEFLGDDVAYVIFITDPQALQLPSADHLINLYGLTTAQARVSLAFAGGETYKEAARDLGISEETVRSHVKEIYPKLRVNRQSDLVRLLLSLGQSAV